MDESGTNEERYGEIELVPDGISFRGVIGETILCALQENNVPIGSSCGGQGTCGECRIRFVDRAPNPMSSDLVHIAPTEIASGWRLACAHLLQGTARIEIRPLTGELNHKEAHDTTVSIADLDPAVRLHTVTLDAPSRDDQRPLAGHLRDALGEDLRIPLSVLRQLADLPKDIRDVSVIETEGELLDVRVGTATAACGLAIDVGTTTLAVYLFDLATGRQLGAAASRNPQRRFGADVISRIAHVRRSKGKGLAELHTSVIDGLNALVDRLAVEASVSPESIYAAAVVGNPTMLHLLLSVDPTGIDVSPYVPVFSHGVRCHAEDVGLAIAPRAMIETLPAISAYVGADIVSGILATGLEGRGKGTLFLDVGTNGEIVLAFDGRLIACSTAAGPAFEGASVVQGMAALDGAIESVRVQDRRIECDVIGDATPTGLCGTGLVSAVAELYSEGIIDPSGRLSDVESSFSDRLEGEAKDRRFRLTDGESPVYLYQRDVREFQLAKAAVRAGIEILLRHAGLKAEKLGRVLIGGAFSARLSGEQLVETGFLPHIEPSRIRVVGNAAGQGAKWVLLNRGAMDDARRLARSVEYIELSADPRFTDVYVEHIPLPAGD